MIVCVANTQLKTPFHHCEYCLKTISVLFVFCSLFSINIFLKKKKKKFKIDSALSILLEKLNFDPAGLFLQVPPATWM